MNESPTDWRARAAALRFATGHFIDGRHEESLKKARFTVINPANERPLCDVAAGDKADVERAVASARRAFDDGAWRMLPPRARLEVMVRFATLIEEKTESLALLETLTIGKPIKDALAVDVPSAALAFRYFAELCDKIEGSVTSTPAHSFHYVLRQPLGVVGCIVPWNYPLLMTSWKVAPALAAGNSVVLKPSELAPLSALALAELFVEAGGPPGVFNVVNGSGEACGAPLALHMDVDKIAFTGSTAVGKRMLTYAGQSNMKQVSLECGGKSPQIFLADLPDLDRAVAYAVDGIFANMGESCSAGSRLLVERPLVDEFVARFVARASQSYRPGDPLDAATELGPLVSADQRARVLGYVESGQSEGARLELGGDAPAREGYYVNPTLFSSVDNRMTIAREEIFGPVAVVIPFSGVDEAITIANDSIYGLGAAVWTRDLTTAHKTARALEAGMVWVNCYDHGDMTQPFGGRKQSGSGRDKHVESLLSYTQTKSTWIHVGQ